MERLTLGKNSDLKLYWDENERYNCNCIVGLKASNSSYIKNVLNREVVNPVCKDGYYVGGSYALEDLPIIYDRLQQYEDLEEKLDIDLITLFKAFTKGIWAKKRDEIVYIKAENLRFEGKIDCGEPLITVFVFKELYYEDLDCVMDTTGYEWELEDYGKTWALTKEELIK